MRYELTRHCGTHPLEIPFPQFAAGVVFRLKDVVKHLRADGKLASLEICPRPHPVLETKMRRCSLTTGIDKL